MNVTADKHCIWPANHSHGSGSVTFNSHVDDTLAKTVKGVKLILTARFEVFTAVTLKNAIFWDVTP
jgi:hypothetical protein